MTKSATFLLLVLFCLSPGLFAQVQVSKEPRHKNVFENRYLRILDVRINPGDTTLFHIHSTPSLFLHFTSQSVCVQIKGKTWEQGSNTAGNASFRSFENDTLIHRVSNCDTVPFHVTDIELLSPYSPAIQLNPLPFTVLFENDKATAYCLKGKDLVKQVFTGRGPMVAQLVSGGEILCRNEKTKKITALKVGGYLYLEPAGAFSFSAKEEEKINLVLFELK